jgi:hypothetical protein
MKRQFLTGLLILVALASIAQSYPTGGTIGSLTITSGQTLSIGAGYTLNVSGALIVNGGISATNATINLTGTGSIAYNGANPATLGTLKTSGSNNTISGSNLDDLDISVLEVNVTGTTSVNASARITGGVKLNAGTLAGSGDLFLDDAVVNYLGGTINLPISISWSFSNYGTFCDNDWHNIGSPYTATTRVNTATAANQLQWWEGTGPGSQGLFTWNEPTSSWQYATALTKGVGATAYSHSNCSTQGYPFANKVTATFPTGSTNEFSFPALTRNASDPDLKGWNLLANPYPSYLDWKIASASGWTRAFVTSFAIYDPTNDSYAYSSANGTTMSAGFNSTIKPFQGFFVKTSFNNYSMKVNRAAIIDETGAGNPFSQPSSQKIIKITASGGTNPALVFADGSFDNAPGQSDAEAFPNDTKVKAVTGVEFSCPEPFSERYILNAVDPCEGDGSVMINEQEYPAVSMPVFVDVASATFKIEHSINQDDYLVYFVPDGAQWNPSTQAIIKNTTIQVSDGQQFGNWLLVGCLVIACPAQ